MDHDRTLRQLLIEQLRSKYARQYSEVKVNTDSCPDIVLSNHGLKIAALCIETECSISEERIPTWRSIVSEGLKLIILVPSKSKSKVTTLLWDAGLMTEISVGTYEINISAPL